MVKKNIIIAIFVAVIVVLVGAFTCFFFNSSESSEVSTSKPITGEKWVWEKTVMNNDEVTTPNQAEAFTVTFDAEGQVTGTTDCNNFFGSYEIENNKITFGPLASTKMFCEDSQENVFHGFLGEVGSFFIDESNRLVLEIKFDSGSIIFKNGN